MNTFKSIRNIFPYAILILALLGLPMNADASNRQAFFAGGCFWCMEHDLEKVPGVISVESGYTGGQIQNPSYKNHQGHQEAVTVNYEPEIISYSTLLKYYWRNIDPFDSGGQFCDRGESYLPVIFVSNNSEFEQSELTLKQVALQLAVPVSSIKVAIKEVGKFWIAEDYHQDFAVNNDIKYKFYRYSCGRDKRLKDIWGDQAGTSLGWDD